EADGLTTFGIASVKGGILDTALSLGIPVQPGWDVVLRARYVAGGADVTNRNIYNWAQFGELAAGFRVDLVQLLKPPAAPQPPALPSPRPV
ncbi:MAG: hypothetical protein H7338_15815, partial [Candidatus Sericytochromatia bacterium]|nr:hypothetical protein [Candidatus Sericytochromatia bacterium]